MTTPYQLEYRSFGEELQVAIKRLLAISHVAGEPMQPGHLRGFFAGMAGLGMEGVRVAYVDMQGFKTPLMETAEILAVEHGFSARVFDNRVAAELWLRHGQP